MDTPDGTPQPEVAEEGLVPAVQPTVAAAPDTAALDVGVLDAAAPDAAAHPEAPDAAPSSPGKTPDQVLSEIQTRLEAEEQRLDEIITTKSRELREIQAALDGLISDASSIGRELDAQNEKHNMLRTGKSALEEFETLLTAADKSTNPIAVTNELIGKKEKSIENKKTRIAVLEAEKTETERVFKEAKDADASVRAKIGVTTGEIEEVARDFNTAKARADAKLRELDEYRKELTKLEAALAEIKEIAQSGNAVIDIVRTRLAENQSEIQKLGSEMDKNIEALRGIDEQKMQKEQTRGSLQRDIQEGEQNIERVRQQLSLMQATQMAFARRGELEQLERDSGEINGILAASRQEKGKANAAVAEIAQRAADVRAQVNTALATHLGTVTAEKEKILADIDAIDAALKEVFDALEAFGNDEAPPSERAASQTDLEGALKDLRDTFLLHKPITPGGMDTLRDGGVLAARQTHELITDINPDGLRELLDIAKSDIGHKNGWIETLQDEALTANARIEALNGKLAEASKAIAAAKAETAAAQAAQGAAEQRVAAIEAQQEATIRDRVGSEVAKELADAAHAREEADRAKRELTGAERTIESMRIELRARGAEAESLRLQLEEEKDRRLHPQPHAVVDVSLTAEDAPRGGDEPTVAIERTAVMHAIPSPAAPTQEFPALPGAPRPPLKPITD